MRIDPDRLFLRCAELEITEAQAMKKAGCSSDLLSRIRQGRKVKATTLAKLAKALQVQPQDLVIME